MVGLSLLLSGTALDFVTVVVEVFHSPLPYPLFRKRHWDIKKTERIDAACQTTLTKITPYKSYTKTRREEVLSTDMLKCSSCWNAEILFLYLYIVHFGYTATQLIKYCGSSYETFCYLFVCFLSSSL